MGCVDRQCLVICCVILVVAGVAGGITALVLYLVPRTTEFQDSFISKCVEFSKKLEEGYNCQEVWNKFKKAYVEQGKCNVSVEAYDPLFAEAPFKHDSSKTLLWSKTKGVLDKFKKKKPLVSLEGTLFGNVTKGYKTWCGRKGSKEIFTYYCPGKSGCNNNSVRSYWNKASAAFAEYAQGEVTALLSGSTKNPFDPKSTFAKFEVPALQPGRVTRLNVVLVTQRNSKSTCASLGELRRALDAKIECGCKEVLESQNSDDSSIPEKPCGSRALQGKGSIVLLAFLFLIITSL